MKRFEKDFERVKFEGKGKSESEWSASEAAHGLFTVAVTKL